MASSLDLGVARLDTLPENEARAALLRCCGSARWASLMLDARPYRDADRLFEAAERAWAATEAADWLEAFSHHPRIGDRTALEARFAATRAWSSGEQGGVTTAANDVLDALAEGNSTYEARFGHVFLVCASGKTAPEMLELLHRRLPNAPETELRVAAGEQSRITRLRLSRLLQELTP